jgi:hypothetical protein
LTKNVVAKNWSSLLKSWTDGSKRSYPQVVPNPLGINFAAGGGSALISEALPIFKNKGRESLGFTDTAFNRLQCNAQGWPTTDFRFEFLNYSTRLPSWALGTFKCGFIGTGSETVTVGGGNATIANLFHGTGGAYTTFDVNVTGTSQAYFDVTGTTGGATNVYAYIPGQYPGTPGIDDVTNVNSLIPSAVTHYSQFNHIRNMWLSNIVSFTQQATSAHRNTPATFQCGSPSATSGSTGKPKKVILTATPTTGATGGTLASAWTGDTGQYALSFQDQSGSGDCRVITLTNGATTCTWDPSRALTQPWSSATGTVAYEGYPVEWLITLCNACGASPWICLPPFEDGAQGSAGSWSTSVLQYIAANYTGSKPVYFELGNENWNVSYQTFFSLTELAALYGFADRYHYYAYRHNQFAALARSILPAGWFGTKVQLVHMDQYVSPGHQISMLSAYNTTYGPPKNDIAYMGAATYANPITTNTDTIAQIQAEATTAAQTVGNIEINSAGGPGEQTAIIGLHYGLPMATYEGGFQWNDSRYTSLANLGAAVMDSGFVTPIETLYNSVFNAGVVLATHFESGVQSSTSAQAPTDKLSNNYDLLATCPNLVGLQHFMPPNTLTITRNDVSLPGAILDGRNYSDNNSNISAVFPSFSGTGASGTNPGFTPYGAGSAGTVAYLLWSNVHRTVALSANFTNSGAAGITELEYGSVGNGGFTILGGGTPTQVTIPTGTNNVSIGSFPVFAGWNYILLGKPGTIQSSISINSVTAG